MEVSGKAQEWALIEPSKCKLVKHMLTHSFLHVSKCQIRLLGIAVLHKLRAIIHLMRDKLETGVPLDKGHQMMFNG